MGKIYFLYFVFLSFLFLTLFLRPITSINEDLGRHLLLGEIITSSQSVPKTNLLSYTYPNFEFINTSWLSAAVFYAVTSFGGYNLLLLFSTGIAAIACFIQVNYLQKKVSSLALICGMSLYLVLLSARTDVRPEIFSMVFISLFLVVLFSFRESQSKLLFLLIPAQILWVNFHIYFITGPLLILLFLVNEVIEGKKLVSRKIKTLLIVFIGSIAATVVNPHGLKGAVYPLVFFKNYGFPVTENQNIYLLLQTFNNSGLVFPVIIAFVSVLLIIIVRRKVSPIYILLLAVFSIAMVISFRNILLFVFGTFIPFVTVISIVGQKYSQKLKMLPRTFPYFLHALFLFLILIVILRSIQVHSIGFGINEKGKPSVDYILQNEIQGPIFNDFNMGSYLSFRVYPQLIYIDGRPEAYPSKFFKSTYLPMQKDPTIFEKADGAFNFNAVITTHYDGFAVRNNLLEYLVEKSDYALVHIDPYALVFLKRNETNENLILKNEVEKDALRLDAIHRPSTLISYLFLFEKFGWSDKGKEAFDQLQKIDPKMCELNKHPALMRYKVKYIKEDNFNKCKF